MIGRTAHEHMVMTELLRAGMQLSLFGISNPNQHVLGGLKFPDDIFPWHGHRLVWFSDLYLFISLLHDNSLLFCNAVCYFDNIMSCCVV